MKILKTLSTKPNRKVAREVTGDIYIYQSKSDMYGNRYWAFKYVDDATGKEVVGMCTANVEGIHRAMGLSWSDDSHKSLQVHNETLPIREFNRLTKGWPYAGNNAEDNAEFIKKSLSGEAVTPGINKGYINSIKRRLEFLRKELRAERISTGELLELQSLVKYIDPEDVELLEAAGVEEGSVDTISEVSVPKDIKKRLTYLRNEIRKERISLDEVSELEGLVEYIDPDDVELLQWAGVEEFPEESPVASRAKKSKAWAEGSMSGWLIVYTLKPNDRVSYVEITDNDRKRNTLKFGLDVRQGIIENIYGKSETYEDFMDKANRYAWIQI